MKKLLTNTWIQFGMILIILFLMSLTQGCEYQTVTHRRIAIFRKGENNGDVSKSRDISSFTHKRKGNAVDKWLFKNIDTSSRTK